MLFCTPNLRVTITWVDSQPSRTPFWKQWRQMERRTVSSAIRKFISPAFILNRPLREIQRKPQRMCFTIKLVIGSYYYTVTLKLGVFPKQLREYGARFVPELSWRRRKKTTKKVESLRTASGMFVNAITILASNSSIPAKFRIIPYLAVIDSLRIIGPSFISFSRK